jgi:hypothetical protein
LQGRSAASRRSAVAMVTRTSGVPMAPPHAHRDGHR